MAKGPSESRFTSKTDFMRYLNDHGSEIPGVESRLREYKRTFPNCGRSSGGNFGTWLRNKYLPEFSLLYHDWWLRRNRLFSKPEPEVAAR